LVVLLVAGLGLVSVVAVIAAQAKGS
jgi:hypothetical protein